MGTDLTTEVGTQQEGPKAKLFTAKDFRLGLASMHEATINKIPSSLTENGIDAIRRNALGLAGSVRATYEILPENSDDRQVQLMLDAMNMVHGCVDIATTNGPFDPNFFIVDLSIEMASRLGRLEAAKTLGYTSDAMPAGIFDAYQQINSPLIDSIKSSWNQRKKSDKAWDEIIADYRESELKRLQQDIERKNKYLSKK